MCCEGPTFEWPISSVQPVKSASLFLVAPSLPRRNAVEALLSSMNSEVRWPPRSRSPIVLNAVVARHVGGSGRDKGPLFSPRRRLTWDCRRSDSVI